MDNHLNFKINKILKYIRFHDNDINIHCLAPASYIKNLKMITKVLVIFTIILSVGFAENKGCPHPSEA